MKVEHSLPMYIVDSIEPHKAFWVDVMGFTAVWEIPGVYLYLKHGESNTGDLHFATYEAALKEYPPEVHPYVKAPATFQ